LEIREFQSWLERWDKDRGWDEVDPSHTLLHIVEEIGEIARRVLYFEGYKSGKSEEELRRELSAEIADALTMLFKLAAQFGIDVEESLEANMEKVEARFPVEAARKEMDLYKKVQAGRRSGGAPEP